jgi:hypothetical protein
LTEVPNEVAESALALLTVVFDVIDDSARTLFEVVFDVTEVALTLVVLEVTEVSALTSFFTVLSDFTEISWTFDSMEVSSEVGETALTLLEVTEEVPFEVRSSFSADVWDEWAEGFLG